MSTEQPFFFSYIALHNGVMLLLLFFFVLANFPNSHCLPAASLRRTHRHISLLTKESIPFHKIRPAALLWSLARIHYVRVRLPWCAAVASWFRASTPFCPLEERTTHNTGVPVSIITALHGRYSIICSVHCIFFFCRHSVVCAEHVVEHTFHARQKASGQKPTRLWVTGGWAQKMKKKKTCHVYDFYAFTLM